VTRLVVLLSALAVACLLSASAAATRRPPLQHVTIFGDSSASALKWDATALEQITKANRVTLELQGCGRLATPGCFSPPPPSVLSEVRTLGRRIGPTAIVLVGYNDDPHVYASGINTVLRAMHKRGVTHVFWLTLCVNNKGHDQYAATNSVIRSASHHWPFMTVVNWAAYSRPHPEWFTDGIHFTGTGAVQFAIYLHRTLKSYGLTGPKTSTSG